MRFHKLEMVGFKSFVDKTTVTFQGGMTAIVGPNGCGKSNISDAIRWVLGEKSAKNLRGDKMEDVIFNGSELRKPLGMAEVSLTLLDVDGAGALGFSEYKDVTITRRLYRDGESEYLINKIPCRLKDIRDLLMDTGVGSKAYSIIEQGRIGHLVQSKPEERRYIIEEVAGITKYKTRKNEALSKLKETEDNLSRVSDIIYEVKRQIGSLDRQARKAERYKKFSTELRGLELKMSWDDYNQLLQKAREADEEQELLSGEESAARNAVAAREADISGARIRLAERERELMDLQREIHRLESEVSRTEARAEVAETQLSGLDEREVRIAEEGRLLAEEEARLDSQASSLKEEERILKAELDAIREELHALESAYQTKTDRAHQMEGRTEEGRGKLFEVQAEISQGRNRLTRMEERKASLDQQARRASEEERETAIKHAEAKLAHDKRRLESEELRTAQAELDKESSAVSDALVENRRLLKAHADELERGREALSQKSSRLQSLVELEESLEGYGEGVKALISEKKQGSLPGIHGLVADLLQAKPEHEKAVEAVLGEKLQHVVVERHSDALGAVEYLKSKGSGRGTFVPLAPRVTGSSCASAPEGTVGVALELVQSKAGYEGVVSALLGNVLVVHDLKAAFKLWGEGTGSTLVTLDGEVLEPHGALTGGVSASGGGLLSKKREIRELTAEVEKLSERNREAEDRLAEYRSELERQEARLKGLHDLINEKRIAAVGLEKDLSVLEGELERVGKKMEVLAIESDQREQEAARIQAEMVEVRGELDSLDEVRLKKETLISELQEELRAVKGELEGDREALTSRKMDLSALIQKHESSARDIKRADLHREELARKAGRLAAEAREISLKREELSAARKDAEGIINDLMRSVIEQKEKVPALQSAYQTANESIADLEEAVKSARGELEAASRAMSDLELRRAEIRLKADHLTETVLHNYHISIDAVEDDVKRMEIDREEAEMNASEIKIKLERLGPVNIGAIEEYNELMERYTFLTSQKDDLESSVRRLKEAIGKINKTSEELFMDAFNSINETFKTVFVSLFNGGQAELRLLPPENGDILESGLEIVAQPPGKKLQNLMLFSGGEKAMIAAALVFACFLVKPSPFCVLDEVDAPLDEANVQRFGNMLKEFADKTQFIVITHSRPTMELADALYGVTMDEPGASRMVSVKLKEAAELAEV